MRLSLSLAVLTVISFATCLVQAAELPAEPAICWIQFNTSSTSWRFDLLPVLLLCLCFCGLCFFLGVLAGLRIKGKRSEQEIAELKWEIEQSQSELQQLQQQLEVALPQRDQAIWQSQRSLALLREFEDHLSEYLTALDSQGLKLRLNEHGNLQETNNEGFI